MHVFKTVAFFVSIVGAVPNEHNYAHIQEKHACVLPPGILSVLSSLLPTTVECPTTITTTTAVPNCATFSSLNCQPEGASYVGYCPTFTDVAAGFTQTDCCVCGFAPVTTCSYSTFDAGAGCGGLATTSTITTTTSTPCISRLVSALETA